MTIQPTVSPAIRLGQFFDFMWGDKEGWVYLPNMGETGEWKKIYFEWPKQRSDVISYALAMSAQHRHVFFGPALYKAPKKHTSKEDILGSYVVWAEYDGNAPEEWTTETAEAADGQPRHAQGYVPPPTLRVQSSSQRNQHCYWRLKEFTDDVDFIERVNRSIAYLTSADTSGWDANQILRPIETKNYKHKTDNDVIVFDENRNEYPLSAFDHFQPVKQIIDEEIDDTDLPPVADVLGRYTWRSDDLELIQKDKLKDSDRSNALFRVACVGCELGLTDREIYSLLIHCDDKWEKFKFRNDRKRRLVSIISQARQKIPHKIELDFAGLQSEEVEVETQHRVSWGFLDLLNAEIKVEWVIPELLPKNGLGVICSAPNVGKTQLTMGMSFACATGTQLLNWSPVARHKVMFWSLEMNTMGFKKFLMQMAPKFKEHEDVLQRNWRAITYGNTVNLMEEMSRKAFEASLEEHRPEGIYIDSLQKIYTKELSKDEIRGLFTYLSAIRQKYGVYIVLIHHDRKQTDGSSNRRPKDLSDVFGSQYITAEPDFVLHMWKENQTARTIELSELKNRYSEVKSTQFITRGPYLNYIPGEGVSPANVGGGLRDDPDGGSDLPHDPIGQFS